MEPAVEDARDTPSATQSPHDNEPSCGLSTVAQEQDCTTNTSTRSDQEKRRDSLLAMAQPVALPGTSTGGAVSATDALRDVSSTTETQSMTWPAAFGVVPGTTFEPVLAAPPVATEAPAATAAAVAAGRPHSPPLPHGSPTRASARSGSLDTLSNSLTSSHHSSVPNSPSILYQPVLTRLSTDGSQRIYGDAMPGCSVSSLSANGSATTAALALKATNAGPSARSVEVLRAARLAGVLSPPEAGAAATAAGGAPSPPLRGRHVSPLTPWSQPSLSQQRQQHVGRTSPKPPSQHSQQQSQSSSQLHGHPQQSGDFLSQVNPALLFMVQALRACRVAEVMCPVVVIGNTKAHAAAAWAALTTTWGASASASSASSPGLTAALTTLSSPSTEVAPNTLPTVTLQELASVLPLNGTVAHPTASSSANNTSTSSNMNNTSSSSGTLPVSVVSDHSASHNINSGALLGSITEFDGDDIDDEQARARGVGKERQREAALLGDSAAASALGSMAPPSVANTVVGHGSMVSPLFDSTVTGASNASLLPSLSHFSDSAAQLINPWPLLFANDTALGLLGYHDLDEVLTREFADVFRCFVYAPEGEAESQQQQQQPGRLVRSLNSESGRTTVDSDVDGTAPQPSGSHFTTTTTATGTTTATATATTTASIRRVGSGRRTPSERPAAPVLETLLRPTEPTAPTTGEGKAAPTAAAAAATATGETGGGPSSIPSHNSKLREVHNLDELFAPRYDSYVFLYSERTAAYYAALAVSSDDVELPKPRETEGGSGGPARATNTTGGAAATSASAGVPRNPYLRLFDSFARWRTTSQGTSATTSTATKTAAAAATAASAAGTAATAASAATTHHPSVETTAASMLAEQSISDGSTSSKSTAPPVPLLATAKPMPPVPVTAVTCLSANKTDLHAYQFPSRCDTKSPTKHTPQTSPQPPSSSAAAANTRYLVLYILQRVETGQRPQVAPRPPVAKPDEAKIAAAAAAAEAKSPMRRVTEIFDPAAQPSLPDLMVAAEAAAAASTGTAPHDAAAHLLHPQSTFASEPVLTTVSAVDVDAPSPLLRNTQQQQQNPLTQTLPGAAGGRAPHGVESALHTPLVEMQQCSPRSSAEWNSSNANNSNTTHSDGPLGAHPPVSKEMPHQSSLFELSYTPFQADLAKPGRTTSDDAIETFVPAAAAMASLSPSYAPNASRLSAEPGSALQRHRQLSPTQRDGSGPDVGDQSATSMRGRLAQMSSPLPLAPSPTVPYTWLGSPGGAGSLQPASAPVHTYSTMNAPPFSGGGDGGGGNAFGSTPQSRRASSTERSHSAHSGPFTHTAQPSPMSQATVAPWRSIQEVRNVEGVAQLAQQVREAHQRSVANTTASSGAGSYEHSSSRDDSGAYTQYGGGGSAAGGMVSPTRQGRGGRDSLGHSGMTEAPPPLSPHSTHATAGPNANSAFRHSRVPSRVGGTGEPLGSRSASQLLGSTAAMSWQRSNEVDQITTKKLADRIRSQRNVVSVVASTRLPDTLIFNSVAFMIFVQQVLRFQQRHGVTQVACLLNVRSKTQLVVDMIPVDRLDEGSQSTSRSTDFTSGQLTLGSSVGRSPPTPATPGSKPQAVASGSESLSSTVRRRLARMNLFYSEEESRLSYPAHSESAYSMHNSSTSGGAHMGGGGGNGNGGEHHERVPSSPARMAMRAGSFVASRFMDGPLRQDSSTLSSTDTRVSGADRPTTPSALTYRKSLGDRISTAAAAAAAATSAVPHRSDAMAVRPTSPVTSVGRVFVGAHRCSSMTTERARVASDDGTGGGVSHQHPRRRDVRRSQSCELRAKRDAPVLAMGVNRRFGMSSHWSNARRPSLASAASSQTQHAHSQHQQQQQRGAKELLAEAAARVVDGSRLMSRSTSTARSGTRTPSSVWAMSLPSHPNTMQSSATTTTGATSVMEGAALTAGGQVVSDSLSPHPHERQPNLIVVPVPGAAHDSQEVSSATHNSSSANNSSRQTHSSKSGSSWSSQWVHTSQLPAEAQPGRRTSSPKQPPFSQVPSSAVASQQQQQQQVPPPEWLPKSDFLSADMQQNLTMCDGDINITAHTFEAQVLMPFITPQRLELLSQLGNVQLSSTRGVSLFGLNLVNMVTEEAAAAAAQPSPLIIPLQYDMAARKYKKDAGEKSTVLPPFNSDTATELDRLAAASGQHRGPGTASGRSSVVHIAAASSEQQQQQQQQSSRDGAISPVDAAVATPPSTARVLSPPALASPARDAAVAKSLVSPAPSSSSRGSVTPSPTTASAAAAAAMEFTVETEPRGASAPSSAGPSPQKSAVTHRMSSTGVGGNPSIATTQRSPSSVSLFAPTHSRSPTHGAPSEGSTFSPSHPSLGQSPETQQLQQQQQSQGHTTTTSTTMRNTAIGSGSVVSVVATSGDGDVGPKVQQAAKRTRRASPLPVAAAERSRSNSQGSSADSNAGDAAHGAEGGAVANEARRRAAKANVKMSIIGTAATAAGTAAASPLAASLFPDGVSPMSPHRSGEGSNTALSPASLSLGVVAAQQKKKSPGIMLPMVLAEDSFTAALAAPPGGLPPTAAAAAAAAPAGRTKVQQVSPHGSPMHTGQKETQDGEHREGRRTRQQATAADETRVAEAATGFTVTSAFGSPRQPEGFTSSRHSHTSQQRKKDGSNRHSKTQSSRDSQDHRNFFPEGLPRDGNWLVQSNEQSTSLTVVAQSSSLAASLPADSVHERSDQSKSLPQHLSMSPPPPPPPLAHPVSVREKIIGSGPSTIHVDPRASPGSINSFTQGLGSVRTQKSGGTELLGYTLSISAAAALGGFSTALMKEATLESDGHSTADNAKRSSKDNRSSEVNSADQRPASTAQTAVQAAPHAQWANPLNPGVSDDAPRPKGEMSRAPDSPRTPSSAAPSSAHTTVATSGAISSFGGGERVNASRVAGVSTSTSAAGAVVADVTGSPLSGASLIPPQFQPQKQASSLAAAAGGRQGSGSGSSNSLISFPAGSSQALEDVRPTPVPRDEANDSFAESFMDIFGLTSHPQRLAELRRQVAERVRDARARSQSGFDSSVSSTAFANTPPSRSFTTSTANAASTSRFALLFASNPVGGAPSSMVNVNATSGVAQSHLSHPEVTVASGNSSSRAAAAAAAAAASGESGAGGLSGGITRSASRNDVSNSREPHRSDGDELLRNPQHEIRFAAEEAAGQLMRHSLHVLVYAPRVYTEMEEVLSLYGHCTTFVTTPTKMLRYARAGLQPFDVLIVEWIDGLVNEEIHEMLARHAVNETVVVYFISTKPGVHTPTMNVENVMTDTTVVIHADDMLTGLLSRNVLEEVQQLIRRRRLLTSMVEMRVYQSYQIVSHIGSGAFGDVFEVLMYVSHGKLAMKRIFLKSMKLRQLEVINREVCILRALEHPNIVSFSHTQLEDNAYSIFMELCDGSLADHLLEPSTAIPGVAQRQQHRFGANHYSSESSVLASLNSKLSGSSTSRSAGGESGRSTAWVTVLGEDGHHHHHHSESIPHSPIGNPNINNNNNNNNSMSGPTLTRPQDAVMIVHDIASALVYLHGRGIIHRDIKPANILFSNGMAKLGDFGSAVKMNESRQLRNMKGTMSYMAPEMVLGEPYTEACDLWSFGCLIASIMGIQLGHLNGLHMPALNELYRSIPNNASLPLTCSNRLSSRFENHYTESTTIRVLAALKRALANEMEERERTPPPPVAPHAAAAPSSSTSPITSQMSVSVGSDNVDEATQERRRVIAEMERADALNRRRSVMCISTSSIDVMGEFAVLLPASLVELFEGLFHRNPAKRMTAADILDHPVSWDVEWMARMMNEVHMIHTQLSLSAMSARASANGASRSRATGGTSSASPLRGVAGEESDNLNLQHGHGSPTVQLAGYVSYFTSQPGGGEMAGVDLMAGGEAGVNVPRSANNYVLDLSLSGGSGSDGDEE